MKFVSTYLTLVSTEELIEEVNENHPEVLFLIEDTLKQAKELNFEQPYEKHAELLEEIIKEVKFSKLFMSLTDLETKNVHLVGDRLSQSVLFPQSPNSCTLLFTSFLICFIALENFIHDYNEMIVTAPLFPFHFSPYPQKSVFLSSQSQDPEDAGWTPIRKTHHTSVTCLLTMVLF